MFSKSIVALITPFDSSGEVDYEAFERLIFMHLESGTSGLLILGSTGEGLSLVSEEKQKLIALAVKTVRGKVPIMVGASSASARTCLETLQLIKTCHADAALVTPPFYVRPSQKGVVAYFQELNQFGFPTVLYHHPGRTGVALTLDTMQQIARSTSIIGIKESSGDQTFFRDLHSSLSTPLFVGDDEALFDLSVCEPAGAISVLANAFPKRWSSYTQLCLEGKRAQASEEHKALSPMFHALSLESNPVSIKYVMEQMELCDSYLRLPLLAPELSHAKILNEALAKIQIDFPAKTL